MSRRKFPKYPRGFMIAHDAFHKNQMCIRKRSYATFDAAYDGSSRVYRCPYCGSYHRARKGK